jgi:nucleoside-diphosphate-sugar epimerase
MSGRVALVTGATGFIGSHVARRLLRQGVKVHVLCRAQSNFHRLKDVRTALETHEVSLSDGAGLTALVRTIRPHQIFHLAAATVVAGVTGSAEELLSVNVLGTVNLLEACAAVDYGSLVTTGDSFEYTASAEPLREDGCCRPDTLHGISKLSATLCAQSLAHTTGRPIVTLRLFSTYGPDDNPRRLVPRVIAGALAGTPIALSRRDISRDWVYVDDVVDLYMEAASRAQELRGGVFNAGSGVALTIGEITDRLVQLTGGTATPQWGVFAAPAHDVTPWTASTSHTFAAFAWRPKTALDDGLRLTIDAIARTTSR